MSLKLDHHYYNYYHDYGDPKQGHDHDEQSDDHDDPNHSGNDDDDMIKIFIIMTVWIIRSIMHSECTCSWAGELAQLVRAWGM